VGAVLDGNFQRDGERIRVTVRLWRVSDGATLWAEIFDQKFGDDLFAMQDAIAERVVAVLPVKLSRQEQQILTRRHTTSIEAYQLWCVGWHHWYKYNQEGWRKSCEYFERAISLDPNYALAYTGLSMAWGALGVNLVLRPKDAFPKAYAAALKAITLDDMLGEAHLALGAVKLYYHWDWPAAQREFGRALELNPRQAYVHRIYGVGYLRVMGRLEEALAENQRAQALEPFSPLMNQGVGRAYYWLRRYDEAIAQLLKTLEMDPNLSFSQRFLADAYEQSERYQEAIAAQQKALTSEGNAELAATLGQVYATAGYHLAIRVVSEKMLGQLHARAKQKYVAPTNFAVLYIRLGDKDQAFAWLDKAVEERDGALLHLKVDPSCDSLRSDPRYASLLRRIGLEP
jgi:tetratricopeptide (TPR) repeat protein